MMDNNYSQFNKKATELIVASLKRAKTDNTVSVYSLHIILEAYKGECAEFLEKATGIDGKRFEKIYSNMLNSNMIERDNTIEDEKTIDDFHDELLDVIKHCNNIAMVTKVRVNPITLLRVILSSRTYARAIFRDNGVSLDRLNQLRPIEYEYTMLKSCTSNMTMRILQTDDIFPVDRPKELNKVIETLGRKDKRNPLLIGESGVGKTAIVELLAKRILDNDNIPEYLKGKILLEVDLSAIVGGSQYRGAFEEKLNNLMYQVEHAENVILFFDEFHTILRAGGSMENDLTASNILKPALARQCIPVIGATTIKEYNKFIEKDEAFSRRFETITVEEPSETDTIRIVTGAINSYEKFHKAEVTPNIIEYAVKLSGRYMTSRKQPDKTFTVIDQTCAYLKMHSKNTCDVIVPSTDDIKNTVSRITGIEIGSLSVNEFERLKSLESRLKESVIGQDKAVKVVSDVIKRKKVGLSAHDKPIGTLLFVGPTGVGKTELCKKLNNEFNNNPIIRFDMSEYMEKQSVSRMIGSPPGYVGHEDGGQLTDAVRRNPYSVVLFDEIEKAHPDVFNILLQILDDGRLTDSHGKVINFCNTIVVMTSNTGYSTSNSVKSLGFGSDSTNKRNEVSDEEVMKELQKTFRPEFLNRLDKVVVFNSLSKEDCTNIAKLMLNKLSDRCLENNIHITFDNTVVENVVNNGFDEKYGARNLNRYIQTNIEGILAEKMINGEIKPNGQYKAYYKNNEFIVKSTRKTITSKISVSNSIRGIKVKN